MTKTYVEQTIVKIFIQSIGQCKKKIKIKVHPEQKFNFCAMRLKVNN